jgi:hypothetical protein
MRSLGHALCNWGFEKCYLPNCPAMHCQFKDGCSIFAHKRCSILLSRTHGQNVKDIEPVGCFCQEHYMDSNKEVLHNQTNNGTECSWAWPNIEKDHVWKEDDMIKFTANGLWFAPHCQKCFPTNKYFHHDDKICGHTWQAQRLDKTGNYILFPSTCWHKGIYQDEFNKTIIQVQLFTALSIDKDTARITRSFVGQEFINGNLKKSSIAELTNNVVTWWDESYPLLEFAPCSKLQDFDVDPVKNQ